MNGESGGEGSRNQDFAGSGDSDSGIADLPTRFRRHALAIERAGRSPLCVELMRGSADDIEAGGYLATLIESLPLPPGQAPALRLLAALHRLVLEGRAPELAAYYPDVGGELQPAGAWKAAERVLRANPVFMRDALGKGVQTNEPGRSAVLFGVLLWITRVHAMPIRIREIGASAGLNLLVDRYAYQVHGSVLGDTHSSLLIEEPWIGLPVDDPARAQQDLFVSERRGCDVAPIDATSDQGKLTLLSYIWPDEPRRLDRMRAALEVADREKPSVDRVPAEKWLDEVLRSGNEGAVTLVWQSVFWQYLTDRAKSEILTTIEAAGERSDESAPLSYVRMEPEVGTTHAFVVTATMWPGGESHVLATCGDHGPPVRWAAVDIGSGKS